MDSHPFGRRIREKRLTLAAGDPEYSLRRLAVRLGIQPSYLSRLERGAPPRLSEAHIVALAEALDEPPDALLALAGKIPSDVREALLARPEPLAGLIRDITALPGPGSSPWDDLRTLASSFRETQRLARVGSFSRDLLTGQDFWSEEFQRIFGLPTGSPVPTFEGFLALAHPDDRRILTKVREALFAKEGSLRYEYRFRRGDGLWRHARAVARSERDASGRTTRIYGTVQDVTTERQALDNLRSMARFPEDNPHPVLRFGRDGKLAYANPAATPLLDAWGMAVGAMAPSHLVAAVRGALETGAAQRLDLVVGEGLLEITLCPLAGREAVNGYGRDVTLERRAEKKRHAFDFRFRQLFDDARLGLFQSSPAGRILAVNGAMAKLFGYDTPEDMLAAIGHDASQVFVDPEQRSRIVERLRREGEVARLEVVNKRRDGSSFIGRLRVRLVEQDGEQVVEGFVEDITERKRTEESLRAREERLQTHLRNFPLPTLTFVLRGRDLVLTEANKAAEALFRGRIATGINAAAGVVFEEAPDVYLALWNALEARRTGRKRLTFRPPGAAAPGVFDMTFVHAAPDTVMLHAEDVTALEQAREDVRRTLEQMRAILDHVPYAASLVGTDGRTLYLNKAFEDIVGYTLADVPDAAAWLAKAYPDPGLRARIAADWQATLGKTGQRVYPVRCGDGVTRALEFTAVPLPDGKMLLTMRPTDESTVC
ncbi:PAS domain S-box protein [Solidesulfovibrio sp.]|uniref:PAS domain S-box protein n=1 Tax=Solidesulfovibrio sp. TaxID=2910990 RepID=UPI0026019BCC|nr:PAS domain S-box protein [Solidesulfovibrio sp.]